MEQETPPTVLEARRDPNAFIEYCVRDEDGRSLRQAWHHREWQALLTDHRRVAILGAAELGKTIQFAWRLLWEIGRNPNIATFALGHTESGPEKTIGVMRRAIEHNARLREVFPHLEKGKPWHDLAINIAGRVEETRDYTVQGFGLNSDILGTRSKIILIDDPHDRKNSATPVQRKKVITTLDTVVQSRLLAGGRVWVVGNAWHKEDALHTLAKRASWTFRTYPLCGADGVSRWASQFSQERIAEIRGSISPLAFARMYQCIPLDEEGSFFREEWFRAAEAKGRAIYAPWAPGRHCRYEDPTTGELYAPRVYVGIDPHSGRSGIARKSDTTAIVVLAIHPSGDIQIYDIQIGRWPTTELLAKVRTLVDQYDPIIAVEDNGMAEMFVQIARADDSAPRVRGVTTGGNKWDSTYGVEGLSVDFEAGRIIAPMVEGAGGKLVVPEALGKLWEGLLYFTPADHTADVVMAFWIAVTAARRWGQGRTGRAKRRV